MKTKSRKQKHKCWIVNFAIFFCFVLVIWSSWIIQQDINNMKKNIASKSVLLFSIYKKNYLIQKQKKISFFSKRYFYNNSLSSSFNQKQSNWNYFSRNFFRQKKFFFFIKKSTTGSNDPENKWKIKIKPITEFECDERIYTVYINRLFWLFDVDVDDRKIWVIKRLHLHWSNWHIFFYFKKIKIVYIVIVISFFFVNVCFLLIFKDFIFNIFFNCFFFRNWFLLPSLNTKPQNGYCTNPLIFYVWFRFLFQVVLFLLFLYLCC